MAEATASVRRTALPVWVIAVTAGLFGLLYAYAVWGAVSFMVQQAGGDVGLSAYGWFVLALPIVFPLAVFAGAFAIGWRRRFFELTLVLLTGLCLVAVFWLDIFAYASVTSSLYGA
ncbi:bacitracin resistance protein [Microbacterium fluvii]|uniref:Bacitracin resistance protein n=1 Tax=Microbacterium fluvii TaxID=415215 RepID=A0ABW2HB22_9MICO|nr:bacitracin resistance protein [Microbacterium fluvii]MCU4672150.1 bacitracin resistance protein [Microbacterium fluvii]